MRLPIASLLQLRLRTDATLGLGFLLTYNASPQLELNSQIPRALHSSTRRHGTPTRLCKGHPRSPTSETREHPPELEPEAAVRLASQLQLPLNQPTLARHVSGRPFSVQATPERSRPFLAHEQRTSRGLQL